MNTKLTLRVDEGLVAKAKNQAAQRGKSVSQMFGEFVSNLEENVVASDVPPVTASLRGILKNPQLSEKDYKRHLEEKHS
jgi:predicted HicB family RNase H-like nuclease